MKTENLRQSLLCCVSQLVRDAGVPAKVFGGSEGRGRVLVGTSTKNIVNILSHHTISRTFHQLAPFFRPGVFSTGTSRPARSCVVPQTSAGEPTGSYTAPRWLRRVCQHSLGATETENTVSQTTRLRVFELGNNEVLWMSFGCALDITRGFGARVAHPSGPEHPRGVLSVLLANHRPP